MVLETYTWTYAYILDPSAMLGMTIEMTFGDCFDRLKIFVSRKDVSSFCYLPPVSCPLQCFILKTPMYSFSRIQLYKQCPLRYKYRYIDDIRSEFEETADTVLGTATHAALEFLYQQHNSFKLATLDEVLAFYQEQWNQKIQYFKDAGQELEVKTKWQTLDDYIARWKHYLISYYENNTPISDEIKIVGTELKIYFEVEEGIKFQWAIDRLDKVWDEFIINDYKTNKSLPPEDKESLQDQLTLYGIWVLQHYGKYLTSLKARLHLLHFETIDEWIVDESRLADIKQKVTTLVRDIESSKKKLDKWEKNAFPPTQNSLCRFCEYQPMCPLFAHMYAADEVASELSAETIRSLVDKYWTLNEQKKEAEQELEVLKEIIGNYISAHDYQRLFGANFKLSFSQLESVRILDKEGLKAALESKWILADFIDIDRMKVQKSVKEWSLQDELDSNLIEKNVSMTFRVSKQ